MKTFLPMLSLTLLPGLALAATDVPDPGAAGALREVQEWLDATRDLDARFEQVTESGLLGEGERETGRVRLVRPGRMRWDYERPEKKVVVVDGRATGVYLAVDRQYWKGDLDDTDSLLPRLLAGTSPLASGFRGELVEEPGARGWRLRLVPTSGSRELEEVSIAYRPGDFRLEEVEVRDAAGNRIVYRFHRLRRNRGVPAEGLDFTPPPGTDIVDSTEGGR